MSAEAVEARRLAKARQAEAIAFVRDYTGTFGLILSIKADRRFGSKHMTLSDRQVEVILASRDRDIARAIAAEDYAAEQYATRLASAREAVALHPEMADALATFVIAEGMYTVAGAPWKVQHTRADHSRLYAKRLIVVEGKGSWEYVPGGMTVIRRDGTAMTLAEAQAFGKLYGICAVCGAELTDENSIAAGIGPVCASRI